MSLDGLLNTSVNLQRQSLTKDTFGGRQSPPGWNTIATAPADIQPASSHVQFTYAQRLLLCTHQIYLTADIGARETDRFQEVSSGRIFKVLGYRPHAPGYSDWPSVADVEEQLLPSTPISSE